MNVNSTSLLGSARLQADMAKDMSKNLRLPLGLAPEVKADKGTAPQVKTEPGRPTQEGEIKQLSEEFESLFLGLVLKSMRDSVQKSGLIDGGNAENIYRSMLDEEYAKQMASQHHTGLADQIAEFLIGQNQAKGQRAYETQGLPDGAKQATIGNKKVTPTASDTESRPLPAPNRDGMISKTP